MAEKSFLAGAAEPVIRIKDGKRKFTDKKACGDYISAMAKKNAEPYRLPKAVSISGEVSEENFQGMQFFTLGSPLAQKRVLYLHGGSYFSPPNLFHWDMLRRLSKLGDMQIIAPIYPRAPIHACSAAYAKLHDLYLEFFAGHEGGITIMGDSAGGGLALGLAQQLAAEKINQPSEIILISPWLDVSMENPEMADYEDADPMLGIYGLKRMGKLWAGALDVHDPKVSPIYGRFDGLGNITMFVGTHEIFYPEVFRFSKLLDENGIPHRLEIGEELDHVWVCYPMPEGRAAIEKIAEIINNEKKTEP